MQEEARVERATHVRCGRLQIAAWAAFASLLAGCFGPAFKGMTPLTPERHVGADRASDMRLFLLRDFDMGAYYLPPGIYDPDGQDNRGIYFKAPAPMQERLMLGPIPVHGPTPVEGGIFVDTEGAPDFLKYWVYVRLDNEHVHSELLPTTFSDGYGRYVFVEGPDGPHAQAAAMRAEVAFTADGKPNGPFRLLNSSGEVEESGTFENGQRQGVWSDTVRGVKVAELSYSDGHKQGPFHTWYSPHRDPDNAGRPCTEGTFLSDQLQGEWTRWDPDGAVRCKVQLDLGSVVSAQCWQDGRELSPKAALQTAQEEVDRDLLFLKQMDDEAQKWIEKARSANGGASQALQ